MEQASSPLVLFVAALFLTFWSFDAALADKKLYIVYMGVRKSASDFEASSVQHHLMLSDLLGSEEARNAMLYSYRESFSGFAATLNAKEAATLLRFPGVLSVFPSRMRKLHTTRSWEFLGVSPSYNNAFSVGSDVVIGVFDTGVWPESESFSDHLLGPIPSRWKGTCETSIKCNRKLVGARYYAKGYESEYGPIVGPKSPRDNHGHGTHTASIAAGTHVQGASLFGLAEGVARGGAPAARLAVYKVCWVTECSDADVLAAFDNALSDGVDILSISLGEEPMDYFQDAVAIGAFHAMQKGILTTVSAGNEGPDLHVAKNIAPWLFTVAASTIDREFVSDIFLGNNVVYRGAGINAFTIRKRWHRLVSGGSVGNTSTASGSKSQFCGEGSLNATKVKGNIVLCYSDTYRPDKSVLLAGGAGLLYVLTEDYDIKESCSFAVPASTIDKHFGKRILAYVNSTRLPFARILPTLTISGKSIKSTVAVFSSRGPNSITPDILKPDVTAPGVDILAAWSPQGSVSGLSEDQRSAKFNIISGTSMSCPHVSGAAAALKSLYPDWTPAALKSALMTTATVLDREDKLNRHGALAYGSGQINPTAATDPGLVYDITPDDYTLFLCSIGYNATQIRLMVNGSSFSCSKQPRPVNSLNSPSIALGNLQSRRLNVSITRTVTNVGPPNSTYYAVVKHPARVHVTILPSKLTFERSKQSKSFKINLFSTKVPKGNYLEGSWEWRDGKHLVRSPIVIWRTA